MTVRNNPIKSTSVAGFSVLAVFVIALTVISCSNVLGPSDINSIKFPASNVSYSEQIQPLFDLGCAFSGCHDPQTQAGTPPLVLDSYFDAISSSNGTIWKGHDTTNSQILWSIEPKNGFLRMPLNRPALNANQINGIKTWILEGCKDN
ncbi:MAG TPA: hypothetical protein VKS81_10350 [Bacteroidota bacterium]|nr:hypothetical protein [Bacteroidota bacterium]